MKSIQVCEYSRSRSFHYDLILQDQASGERSQDQWSSGILEGLFNIKSVSHQMCLVVKFLMHLFRVKVPYISRDQLFSSPEPKAHKVSL